MKTNKVQSNNQSEINIMDKTSKKQCKSAFVQVNIEKLTIPSEILIRKRVKDLKIKVTIGGSKLQQQISAEDLNDKVLPFRFICTVNDTIRIEVFRSLTITQPEIFTEFPLAKMFQIEETSHCLLADFADYESFHSCSNPDVISSGSAQIEVTIFRRDIGYLSLNEISLSCLKELREIENKTVYLRIECDEHSLVTPHKEVRNGKTKWQQIKIPIPNVDCQIMFVLMDAVKKIQIGRVLFAPKSRNVFEQNECVKISDLPIEHKGERLIEFYCVGVFTPGLTDGLSF